MASIPLITPAIFSSPLRIAPRISGFESRMFRICSTGLPLRKSMGIAPIWRVLSSRSGTASTT